MRAVYIGSYATGTIHQMFDTCFLHVCSIVFDHIDCYKDESTFPFILEMGEKYDFTNKVTLHRIKVLRGKSRTTTFLHYIKSALINLRLLLSVKADIYIYAYNNPFFVHIVNIVNRFVNKKIIICAHGELELLVNNDGGVFAKINRTILRNYFFNKNIHKNIYFSVLGNSIYSNLLKILPEHNIEHIYPIDHPYYFNEAEDQQEIKTEGIHFGLLGTLSPMKGLEYFQEFTKKIKTEDNNKYKISIIGRINNHDYDDFLKEYDINVTWSYLSRAEFEGRIRECDIILFFYPPSFYKLIASGTIMDAICMDKPILALHNDYFDYIVEKSHHPAILCNSVEEMVRAVHEGHVLSIMGNHWGTDKKAFSPETIADQLQSLVSKFIQ